MEAMRFAWFLLLGLMAGSLINYLADVLPVTRRFTRPTCSNCLAPQPVGRYLALSACPNCGKRRVLRAWIVLAVAVAGTLALGTGLLPAGRLGFWVGMALLTYFGVVGVIDLEHRLILHPVSLAGAVLGLAVGVWLHGWLSTLLGGLAGFGIMLGLFYLGALFARWLARRRGQETDEDALGFGDVALSGVLGLLLGWPGIVGGLFLAILFGGIGGLVVLLVSLATRRYHAFMAIPYGPFLLLAAVVLLFRAV